MNIFLYTMLFLIGALVGNFWKMAIYRIPRNIKLNKKGVSYIEPNSKSNRDSQLFYLILGGIIFIIFGKALKIDINNIQPLQIITYIFTILYVSVLMIIAGIDQKLLKMEKSVITAGIILSILYNFDLEDVIPFNYKEKQKFFNNFTNKISVDNIFKEYIINMYLSDDSFINYPYDFLNSIDEKKLEYDNKKLNKIK